MYLILVKWMNLEPVIQSEVSQKRKTNINVLFIIIILIIDVY